MFLLAAFHMLLEPNRCLDTELIAMFVTVLLYPINHERRDLSGPSISM